MFWIKKIRPLSGTDIKFRNHPVSPLKQARFCNVPAYATSVTGSTRENLLTCLKLSAFLLRDDIQNSAAAASHHLRLSVDTHSLFLLIPFSEFSFMLYPFNRTKLFYNSFSSQSRLFSRYMNQLFSIYMNQNLSEIKGPADYFIFCNNRSVPYTDQIHNSFFLQSHLHCLYMSVLR